MKKSIILLICALSAGYVMATPPWTQDTGLVTTVYATADGKVAVSLSGGFPHAIADGQCPTSSGDTAGNVAADPFLKAVLLAAKTSNQSVTVTTAGCAGAWLKIIDVYLR